MRQPQGEGQHAALTLERFIQLASKGAYVRGLKSALATALSILLPLPSLRRLARRLRDAHESHENGMRRLRAIYAAMTPTERDDRGLIDHPRRAAIAAAAGVEPMDVSQLRRNFEAANRVLAMPAAGTARR